VRKFNFVSYLQWIKTSAAAVAFICVEFRAQTHSMYISNLHVYIMYYIISIKMSSEWLLQYKCSWFPPPPPVYWIGTQPVLYLYTYSNRSVHVSFALKTVVAPFLCYILYSCWRISAVHIQRKQFWAQWPFSHTHTHPSYHNHAFSS